MGNEVLAVDWKQSKVLWRYAHPKSSFQFYASPVVANGLVIIGGRDKRIHAINEQTGELVWEFQTRSRVDSSPVLAGGVIWVGSNDGSLYALDAKTGAEKWKFTLGGAVVAQAAISGDRLVIGSRDGVLFCLRKK